MAGKIEPAYSVLRISVFRDKHTIYEYNPGSLAQSTNHIPDQEFIMEETKTDFIEEYKENLKHHKKLIFYGITIIIDMAVELAILIFFAVYISRRESGTGDGFLLFLFFPIIALFVLFIPFIYHSCKTGICPNCKKHMDRGLAVFCKFCGVRLQDDNSKKMW